MLQDNDLGTIDTDLFFQKIALDKKGIHIADIGAPNAKGQREVQPYELYARGKSDIDGYKRLRDIRAFLRENYSNICELPAVPKYSDVVYKNVELTKPSSITNVGEDAQGRIIFSITGQIIYKGE